MAQRAPDRRQSLSARDAALFELDARRLPGWPPGSVKARRSDAELRDPRDRALAEQITIGVIKNLLHLQHLTAHYARRPLKKIDSLAQKLLAMGLYQLRFLDRIPKAAAVHETVEQSKKWGKGRAAGFINAVLRKAIGEPEAPLPGRDEPEQFAEKVLSHPTGVFKRFVEVMGVEDALRLCEHDNAEAPTIVRLYDGVAPSELRAEGVTVTPHEQPGVYVVSPVRREVLADWAKRRIAQVQDPTAAIVVPKLGIEPGQTVLDRCCGLGTKTLQIRHALGEAGKVVAVDPSEARCRTLVEIASSQHMGNLAVRKTGMLTELGPEDPTRYDRILIDAPCSNSGVFARRPEARYAQTETALASLASLQDRILDDTAPALRPGGRLVYSTCSIWPEENERRMEAFLARHPSYHLVEQQTTLPSLDPIPTRYRDGGYYAVLELR